MASSNGQTKSIIIIGAGIAGLSAGVYAQRSGYSSHIFEMHNLPGGLMTAWKRKGYTIDGCIHWLAGSSPQSNYYPLWEEIGLIQGREFYYPEVFMRLETADGKAVNLYSDLDRLEKELLEIAPEDSAYIHEFLGVSRAMLGWQLPIGGGDGFIKTVFGSLKGLPKLISLLPKMRKWGGMDLTQFAAGFKNPTLREAFSHLWFSDMSAGALLFMLTFLHEKSVGYPIGGSLPMARAVEKRYLDLGGEITYEARVDKILVENNRAVGIRLADGSEHRADTVISAADGHTTIFDMLEGRYVDDKIKKIYAEFKLFPSILFIGLGVNRTFADLPGTTGGLSLGFKQPIDVLGQSVEHAEVMVYNFDPTLSPQGKTTLTVMLKAPYANWKELSADTERYEAEKQRIALETIQRLDARFPGLAEQVEMANVATPTTFERFTGNWQGSFEGFIPTPKTFMAVIPKTLPGLSNFYMAGQWVQAGGGVPTGLTTGRGVIMQICKQDGMKYNQNRSKIERDNPK